MRRIRLALAGLATLPLALLGQLNAGESEDQVSLEVGDEAPDFNLPASDGNEYKLSEVLKEGPVVLAWFPRADTPGCTAQCKSIAKNGDMIREYNVTYFMISVDTVEDNTKFAEKYSADFPILSDTTKEVANKYGVMMSKWNIPNRHTYYIGTDGKILKIDRSVKVETTAEDIAASLKELKVDRVEST